MDAVTVTTNDGPDLERLLNCEPLRKSFERLIVVDNVSSDDSAELARDAGAEVLPLKRRRGYGSCINAGASLTEGPRFAVLNPDITFEEEHVVPRLTRHLEREDVALAAPALVLPDGRIQDSARQIPTPLDLLLRRWVNARRGAIYQSGDVPWVVGACFVARREAWDAVGGFDERYFLYFDDVDLCWRLRQAGWSTVLDTEVKVNHQYGAASRKPLNAAATREHIISATRFFVTNPRFILPRILTSPELVHRFGSTNRRS